MFQRYLASVKHLCILSWIDLLSQQAGAASPPYKNVPGSICSASKKLLLHTQALAILSTTINDASSIRSATQFA
uniref:Secreted protein n=1 Tax=Oryza meridionalis TaxID=40149 RepID=A0A0E0D2D3_9ORYZ